MANREKAIRAEALNEKDLLPCPFCGQPPFVWRTTWDTYVECSKYHADRHRIMVSAPNDYSAFKLWNQRRQ